MSLLEASGRASVGSGTKGWPPEGPPGPRRCLEPLGSGTASGTDDPRPRCPGSRGRRSAEGTGPTECSAPGSRRRWTALVPLVGRAGNTRRGVAGSLGWSGHPPWQWDERLDVRGERGLARLGLGVARWGGSGTDCRLGWRPPGPGGRRWGTSEGYGSTAKRGWAGGVEVGSILKTIVGLMGFPGPLIPVPRLTEGGWPIQN